MKKSTYPWIFSVVVLTVLLVITFFLGYTGYFFSLSYLSSETDLTLGDSVLINISPNETSVVSYTFDGAYLPGERLEQIVQIKASDLESDLRVRVKAEVFSEDETFAFDFVTTEDFVRADDGYFYLNGSLAAGNKTTFCTSVILPSETVFSSGKKYVLSIIVENLEDKFDVDTIWQINKENT